MATSTLATGPAPRRGLAITSLVLGILANLCLWFIAAIPAIITGHIALSRARRSPGQYGGRGLAITGLVLGYLGLVLGAVVMALVLARGVPRLQADRELAQDIRCVNQLKTLGLAARIYASEHGGVYPPDFAAMSQQLGDLSVLRCPADPASFSGAPTNPENVSYEFLAPGAAQTDIAQQIAFRCKTHGNVALGDGSVHRR
jgi:hypothetical protein